MQDVLSLLSGGVVGFTLGLIGGGGSILAVPLLVYVVGVASPHIAIGTSAVAVAVSAAVTLYRQARLHNVKWRCGAVFALAGIIGAALGAWLGQAVEGAKLLAAFGGLMIVVGLLMLRPRRSGENPDVRLSTESMRQLLPSLIGWGLAVGLVSGFFGIGGGFLIVPGLIGATAMPLLYAIGSSLISVTAFGLTTAASYAMSDLVDWRIAALFILGGALGGQGGIWLGARLASHKTALARVFAGIVITAGVYVASRALGG